MKIKILQYAGLILILLSGLIIGFSNTSMLGIIGLATLITGVFICGFTAEK